METLLFFLKDLLNKSSSANKVFKRNILKEYLQVVVLDFIYSHPKYSRLVFYGGSCLAHCHGLPRLSEDLDFVDLKGKIELTKLAKDLEIYFNEKTGTKVAAVVQKFRIYLKFPVLHTLGLAEKNESDLLFLKVEIFDGVNFCPGLKTEIVPLFKLNRSILIKTFDLPTLMATKIQAVLARRWEKADKSGRVLIKVKGRDFFDLMWYLEKGIKPNLKCLGAKDMKALKKKLLAAAAKVDIRSLRLDLEPLIDDRDLIKNLSRNLKEILKRQIQKL